MTSTPVQEGGVARSHSSRRASARLLAVTGFVAGVAALVPVGAADALPQEGFTLPARGTVEREYPPIPGQDPATVTVDHTIMDPETCAQAPSCAVVPIDVEVPDLDPADDFYMVLTIGFDAEEVGAGFNSNDLDTFLYDDGQKAEEEGGSGYTEIGSSASGDNPEVIKAFEPTLGRYNLVVINFAGGNTGWTLKAESLVGEFEKPIESLSPSGGTVNRNKPTTTTTTTTRPPDTTTTVTVPEGVIIPDDDFEGGAFAPEQNDFQAQLENAAADFQELEELRAASEDSPSALVVAAWMILLPGGLAAAVFVAVRARRSRRRAAGAPAA